VQIELRAIDEVKPYDKNPRRNDDAVEAVARSLREFGFRQPIVVDAEGTIVGHTRWKAARKLGLERVPFHVAAELTAEQAKAYRIADNQTATIAEWDDALLSDEVLGLQALNYDLANLGFDDDELKELLAPQGTEGETDTDDVPEPPPVAVTQPGDLWLLGEHRLLCGDSTKPADVEIAMTANFRGLNVRQANAITALLAEPTVQRASDVVEGPVRTDLPPAPGPGARRGLPARPPQRLPAGDRALAQVRPAGGADARESDGRPEGAGGREGLGREGAAGIQPRID
jgi:ParB-like chromosome segregation protein Spo0J